MAAERAGKSLVIFPGSGSPLQGRYVSVYRLLEQLGRQNGFDRVEVLQWPGQGSPSNLPVTGALSPDSAYQHAVQMLDHVDGSYDVLARSFGCYIAARCAATNSRFLGCLRLWGPPPFWKMWNFWRRNIVIMVEQYRERGTVVDRKFFDQLEPLEMHLTRIERPVVLAGGENDEHCRPIYLEQLTRLIVEGGGSSSCRIATGAMHEVDESASRAVVERYEKALFGM